MSLRDVLGLLLSVGLPWIAGALWVRAAWRNGGRAPAALCLGYGYPLGLFATTLIMRAVDATGQRWTLAWIALPLLAIAIAGGWRARPWQRRREARRQWFGVLVEMPAPARRLFGLFLVLCAANVAAVALQATSSLLLPLDGWAQWASKSRIWYEYGQLAPFVPISTWTAFPDAMQFTDRHPGYPGTVPLFQVWTAIALGRWDESLVNAPWIAAYCALGLAFYAQLRRIGSGPMKSLAGAYLVLSLPFLQIHAAVAGMADIFVALAYALAAASLWRWTMSREWQEAALALAMTIVCAALKTEGIVWALTLAPALVMALNRRAGFALAAAACGGAALYLAYGPPTVAILGYELRTRFENVSLPVFQHMFVMDNWHLLWYACAAVIAVNARTLLRTRLAPMTMSIGAGLAFVVVVFFFSTASFGVDEESVINRLLLHIVPALAFYLLLILREGQSAASAPAAPSFKKS